MIIDYSVTKSFDQSIDIVDAGNTCLKCTNSEFCEYYYMTKSIAGRVYILKFGPVLPDLGELCGGFAVDYYYMNYNDKKLAKDISLFINDSKKGITEVEAIEPEEGLAVLPNIGEGYTAAGN